MKMIPPQVHLLPEIHEYAQIERPLNDVFLDGYWRIVLARLKAKRQFARYAKRNHPKDGSAIFSFIMKNVVPLLPPISPTIEYDLAVSFLTPHNIVMERVRAKKKAAWIHTDYSKVAVDRESQLKMWSAYDRIISISDRVSQAFLGVFPELSGKLTMLPHFMPIDYIRRKAEEEWRTVS